MKGNSANGWQTAEVETLAPKYVVSLEFTRCPSVKRVIQTQLTEVPEVQILLLLHSVTAHRGT